MTLPRPQRLFAPSKPGSLLKHAGAADLPQQPRKLGVWEDVGYLRLIRQLPCLYCGVEPCGEAAHVKFSSAQFGRANSLGKRPHDRFAVPLCRDDHQNARHAQHKGNEEAFWIGLGISPYPVAAQLYAQRGDLVAMRAVIYVTISQRGIT